MTGVNLWAHYQYEAWPTLAQLRDLPPSLTGLGLDQPLAAVLEATEVMDREALRAAMKRFCRSNGGEGEHQCECTVMDVEGAPSGLDELRADAHVTAEDVASHRLFAAWALQHDGPQMPFNGVPVGEYIQRFAAYEF